MYLTFVEQAHLHVPYAPIPVKIDARKPVPYTVLVASILLAQHEVHVVLVGHCGSGIRPILVSPSLWKRTWAYRHDPDSREDESRDEVTEKANDRSYSYLTRAKQDSRLIGEARPAALNDTSNVEVDLQRGSHYLRVDSEGIVIDCFRTNS